MDLCRLAASLGFNRVELQTEMPQFWRELGVERGETVGQSAGLRAVGDRLRRDGSLDALEALGLRVVLWTREVEDHDLHRDGPIAADNHALFEAMADRYDRLLTEDFSEIDSIALTVAEASAWVADPAVIERVCETVHAACRRHGKTLIVRSFAYEGQRAAVSRVLRQLPGDVLLMSKYNPRDWHLRGVRNPIIGHLDPSREIVEEDLAGEYYLTNQVGACLLDTLQRRHASLEALGVRGVTLRCNRGWDPAVNYQGSIFGEVQESHLWGYASWLDGSAGGDRVIDPLRRWAASTFGEDAPLEELAGVFRPTGEVLAEALLVGFEPFGDLRSGVPIARTTGRGEHIRPARRLDDEEAERSGDPQHDGRLAESPWGANSAFHHALSNHAADPAFVTHYQALRRGEPAIIEAKRRSLADASRRLESCRVRFDGLAGRVSEEPWRYFKFKLDRLERVLRFRGHAMMAYLLASQRLYADDAQNRAGLAKEINDHLAAIGDMADRAAHDGPATQKHRGRTYTFTPWPAGMAEFAENLRAHFDLQVGRGPARSDSVSAVAEAARCP
ncbi:MAG: hypothetical protein AAF823_07845 [Planctomycetota bacterium]